MTFKSPIITQTPEYPSYTMSGPVSGSSTETSDGPNNGGDFHLRKVHCHNAVT